MHHLDRIRHIAKILQLPAPTTEDEFRTYQVKLILLLDSILEDVRFSAWKAGNEVGMNYKPGDPIDLGL